MNEPTTSVIPFDFELQTRAEPLLVEFDLCPVNSVYAVQFVYLVFEDTQKLRNALEKKS